ncbi:unnamed protein product [Lampetra planeri]
MDQVGWDSLSIKKLLLLAQKLQVVLPATENDNLLSFKVVRYLEANVNIRRRAGVVASTICGGGESTYGQAAPASRCCFPPLQSGGGPRTTTPEGEARELGLYPHRAPVPKVGGAAEYAAWLGTK